MKTYMYGKHAVGEALAYRPDVVTELYFARQADSIEELRTLAEKAGIKVRPFNMNEPPKEVEPHAVHQGVVATIDTARLLVSFDTFLHGLLVDEHTALVVLNELQDPQNVGAIIRSSAGFGIAGILIPPHDQAQVGGAVIKVSAGTAFRVPLVEISNVNSTLRTLKDKGFWIYGLTGKGDRSIYEEVFDAPAVFVLGNEAKGIREKTLEVCDFQLLIPLHEQCESLNVAVAGAVVLSTWSFAHPSALKK